MRNQEPFYLHPHKDPPTSQHLGAVDYLDVRAVRMVEFYLKTIMAKQLRMTTILQLENTFCKRINKFMYVPLARHGKAPAALQDVWSEQTETCLEMLCHNNMHCYVTCQLIF